MHAHTDLKAVMKTDSLKSQFLTGMKSSINICVASKQPITLSCSYVSHRANKKRYLKSFWMRSEGQALAFYSYF